MPDSIAQQPICRNWQPVEPDWTGSGQANSPEKGKISADLTQTQCETSFYSLSNGHCMDPSGWPHAPDFSFLQESFSISNKSLTKDFDKRPNMYFQKLMAMAEAARGNQPAIIQDALSKNFAAEGVRMELGATSSCFRGSCVLPPPIESGQYKMFYEKPRPCSPVIGQRFDEEPEFASLPAGASSAMPSNTACIRGKCKSLQWEPITPQKINKAEYYQLMKPAVIDQTEMEKSNSLIIDQSSSVTSTQLQESHKPDKGGLDLAGLLKTPQQKARRKKHRPKVIIEGEKNGLKTTKKPNGPKESPNVTRKYIRRKGVVDSELCRETDVNDSNRKETTLLDTPPAKRKYVRRKGVTKHEVEVDGDTAKTAALNASQIARRSCKQALTFNLDSEAREKSSFQYPSLNYDGEPQGKNHNTNYQSTTLRCEQGMMKKDDVMNSHESTQSLDRTHYTKLTKGKCPIVFPNVTRDKETITVQVRAPSAPRSPNVSLCSSTYWVSQTQLYAQQVSALKRQNTNASVEWEISHKNEAGTRYNFAPAYFPTFSQKVDKNNAPSGVHSPIIYKRRRTEKGCSIATSSSQLEKHALGDSCTRHNTSMANQACNIYNQSRTNTANGAIQAGWSAYEDRLDLGRAKRIRKKRSKGSTRPRDLSSLLEICRQQLASTSESAATPSRMKQKSASLRKPPTCVEAYVADTTQTTLKTKNCAKRRLLSDSMPQNLYNCQHSATIPMGPPLALTWRTISPVDSIMEQLRRLDLNATSQPSKKKGNAFITYHSHCQEQHALVPFQRGGALIPFERPRRRRLRAKVNLDDETNRVWKLLIEDINSEGIDGTDEEKTKWWEEERRVFIGRADSFIARMHLVQGDRRFSPWKGSVVDSVVGVFLTQNVSDHLSSSAFMSVAARFPPKSKTEPAEFHEVDRGTKEICELDRDGTFGLNDDISSKSVYNDRHLVFKDDIRESSENAAIKSISFIEDGRDVEDAICSQNPEFSSQNSSNSPMAQATEQSYSCLPSTSEEPKAWAKLDVFDNSISFMKLLQMAGTVVRENYEEDSQQINSDVNHWQCQSGSLALELQNEVHMDNPVYPAQPMSPSSKSTLCDVVNAGSQASVSDPSKENSPFFSSSTSKVLCLGDISELSSESASGIAFQKITDVCSQNEPKHVSRNAISSSNDQGEINRKIVQNQNSQVPVQSLYEEIYCIQEVSKEPIYPQNLTGITNSSCNIDNLKNLEQMEVNSNKNDSENHHGKMVDGSKGEGGRPSKDMESTVHWDQLRKEATDAGGKEKSRTANTMDSVDWDAVRCADVNELAETIKERGMNNRLAERIKDFLDRLVRDHGSIDLEWLRDVLPDKAKEYLLSIRGLGLKSVECVRLLTLHHLAFPVDTNVGRIAVRLGWVPLQQLPESLQLHLLELYPVLESIQKYLWPRLCKLDQRTLYELHYQMITFGKVFCTKSKPNCNACPMRGECRHFASAFASARLSLPAPEEKRIVSTAENRTADQNPMRSMNTLQLPSSETNHINARSAICNSEPIIEEPPSPEPIIEMPATPEQDCTEVSQCDIENAINEDPDEIPSIELNMEEFTHNLQMIMEQNTELQEGDMSKALVALTSAAASIPVPKLKNVSRLRTEHQVYELPDSHPLLEGIDKREPDDPSPYLLAIWTPGETVDSIEPPERRCNSSNFNKLCTDETCSSCNSIREAGTLTVRGTLLIPCRTAMRGSFPLNGTYFQVNEVFSDHESSLSPIVVPREWLWNLPKRTVFFGTSIPTIFKGLTTEGIQYCFWRGFVCVRGFDRKTRAPRPLIARLHFPASKMAKQKGKMDEK